MLFSGYYASPNLIESIQLLEMKYYLSYHNEKSDKFWQIETLRNSFTIIYGKIGEAGTSRTKTFINHEVCVAEASKLIKQKLSKGYIDRSDHHLTEWKQIVDASDLSKALINHFSYLADTPDWKSILVAIISRVASVEIREEIFLVHFSNGSIMECSAPATTISKKLPSSLKRILSKHKILSWESGRLMIGDHRGINHDWLDASECELLNIVNPPDIISPLQDYSGYWIFHPKEKNIHGQPVIYHLSYEDGHISDSQDCNAGSLFLRRIAQALEISIILPFAKNIPPLK